MPGGLGGLNIGGTRANYQTPIEQWLRPNNQWGPGAGYSGTPNWGAPRGDLPEVQVDPSGRSWQYTPGNRMTYDPDTNKVSRGSVGNYTRIPSVAEEWMSKLWGAGGGGGAGGAGSPLAREAAPSSSPFPVSAAYGKVSDAAGRVSAKALEALKDVYSSRGLGGTGLEGAGNREVLQNLAGVKSQALWDAGIREWDRDWEAAKLGYEGAINQRGQDTSVINANTAAKNQWLSILANMLPQGGGSTYQRPPAPTYGGGGGLGIRY